MNDTFWIYTCSCPPSNFPHFLPFIPNDQVINTLIQNPSRSVITSQHIISLAWPDLQLLTVSLIVAGFSSYKSQVIRNQCDFSSFFHTYARMKYYLFWKGSKMQLPPDISYVFNKTSREIVTRYHHLLFLRQWGLLPLFLKT